MFELLQRVQSILSVDVEKETQLEAIIQLQYDALLTLLNVDAVPDNLLFIVVETAIARYNRLGSEGLSAEGIDVISQTFTVDLFEPYMQFINAYQAQNKQPNNSKKLRLL